MYLIPPEQGGPDIPLGIGFPFRHLLLTRRATVQVFYPASMRESMKM
jgi:hypothetical protein